MCEIEPVNNVTLHSLISSRKFEVMLCYNAHISCIVEWCIQCTSWAIAQKSHECAKYLFHAEKQWTFAKMSYLHRYLLDEAITKLCGFKATLFVNIEQISSNLKLFFTIMFFWHDKCKNNIFPVKWLSILLATKRKWALVDKKRLENHLVRVVFAI